MTGLLNKASGAQTPPKLMLAFQTQGQDQNNKLLVINSHLRGCCSTTSSLFRKEVNRSKPLPESEFSQFGQSS